MADEVDVETTLLGIIVGALYPSGTSQPSTAGVPVSVFRGWPTVNQQEATKTAAAPGGKGLVNVSIAARNGVERNVSRYPYTWQTTVPPSHSLTVIVNNNVVTFGGTVAVPQNILIIVGSRGGENDVFNYAVQSADTLSTIAATMATLISVKYPGTSSTGAVLTIHTGKSVITRIASSGTVLQEVGRQEKSFQISIWAPPCNIVNQDADFWRTAVAKVIDPAIKSLVRIIMPDLVYAHVHYERTITMDAAEMQGLYRRDLYYWVEYATTVTQTAYEIGAFENQITPILISDTSEDLSTQGQNLSTTPAGSQTITTNS